MRPTVVTSSADRVLLRWLLCAALVVGAGAVAWALVPSVSQPRACTVIGADPGVTLRSASGAPLPRDWRVEVRRGSQPWVAAPPTGDGVRTALLPLPEDDEVELAVRVSDPRGVLAESTATVRTVPFSPNGRACDPTVGRAVLLLSPAGDVSG